MLIQPNTKTLILEMEADDPQLVLLDLKNLEYNFRLLFEKDGQELAKIEITKRQLNKITLPFRPLSGNFQVFLENVEDSPKQVEVEFVAEAEGE